MSSTHNNSSNRGITLTDLADLGSVIDVQSLPPGPEMAVEPEQSHESSVGPATPAAQNLAGLLAQLSSLSGGLESMARQDARAREQATIDLAQYETLLGERPDGERALAEARRLRAVAEQLSAEAFTDEARALASQHAAAARAAELSCTQLLAERTRAADELASRPHLARALAERRRLAKEQAEAAERAEAERAGRLAHGIAAVRAALSANQLDEAERLLGPLAREFRKSGKCKAWPTSSAGESGNGWWCQPRMPCATPLAVPIAMIPRLLSLVWPACRWTVYPTTSRGVFSGCGRTRALNWSSSVAGTSRTATRRRPVGAWSSLGRHPRGRTKSSAHLARPSGSRASSSWVHSRAAHGN